MDFGANKTPIEVIKKHLQKHILETFILVLIESDTESQSEPFLSVKISSYSYSFF